MVPCLVLGDSLAVGVGLFEPKCETIAKVGISSKRYIDTKLGNPAAALEKIVISLGVNDGDEMDTLHNLRQLRERLHAETIYWLLPGLKPSKRAAIRTVAAEHGDVVIDTTPQVGADHLHPNGAGYRYIAGLTDRGEGNVALADAPASVPLPLHILKGHTMPSTSRATSPPRFPRHHTVHYRSPTPPIVHSSQSNPERANRDPPLASFADPV